MGGWDIITYHPPQKTPSSDKKKKGKRGGCRFEKKREGEPPVRRTTTGLEKWEHVSEGGICGHLVVEGGDSSAKKK